MLRPQPGTPSRGRPRQVDWALVDRELRAVPTEYKNQKFDSLKHVLTVLGAVDSEGALEEVRVLCTPSFG